MIALTMLSPVMARDASPPLPPPRPDRLEAPAPGQNAVTMPRDMAPTEETGMEDREASSACLGRLAQRGVVFESRAPVQEKGCGIEDPVLVSALPNGVALAPASLMACPMAESLARWIAEVVAPEAERQLQSVPVKLVVGTSYLCRDQRNGAKPSEHAFGNGVDVVGFEFGATAERISLDIAAQAENSPEANFQDAIRKAACPIFTTVLGPGADADHGDHLHLDLRQRKGGYRICQ
ncbi:hypothetical protein GGR34_002623 [Microvirga flocculans]|uniref:Extensin-like C-terminal domain-containing protein n=1 Tax=Microvirga flocculans TaxID=217168 RepID=A0A7W6IHJ3_9HYPH|nr:extensin family protein [Microvirga flocculans]MBB4040964.1 hypothetical protein [Microvirga flocculans]